MAFVDADAQGARPAVDHSRLLLIDVSNWLHRFYATTGRFAAYHARTFIERVLDEYEPEYAVACCDYPAPTFRHKLSRAYKANRGEPEPELLEQLLRFEELLADTLGLWPVSVRNYEADDIIATLATRGVEAGAEVRVLGVDKDMAQLVGERCVLWDGKKKLVGVDEVRERYGVEPAQMREWQALVGDSTDGVRGAKGIGPKQATAILRELGSLEAALAADRECFKAAGLARAYDLLQPCLQQVVLAYNLVTLRTDVPLGFVGLERLRLV